MDNETNNFKEIIQTILDIPIPSKHFAFDNNVLLLFDDRIVIIVMPNRNFLSNFHKFKRATNPSKHIVEYCQEMSMVNLLRKTPETITCKIFGSAQT